jgi:hypothetical protein
MQQIALRMLKDEMPREGMLLLILLSHAALEILK